MKKCKDCGLYECARRGDGETECFYDADLQASKELEEKAYWQSFRAEAAKDILCSMIQGGYAESRIEYQSELAVKYATELVKQLKEKEGK